MSRRSSLSWLPLSSVPQPNRELRDNQPLHLTRLHYGLYGFNVSPAAAQVNGVVRHVRGVKWKVRVFTARRSVLSALLARRSSIGSTP